MNDDTRRTDPTPLDADLRALFERRASRAVPAGLRDRIVTETAAAPQRRGRWLPSMPAVRLLALAGVATALGLAGLLGAGAQVVRRPPPSVESIASPTPAVPTPIVAQRSDGFSPAFEYRAVDGFPTSSATVGNGLVGFTVGGPGVTQLDGGGTPASAFYPVEVDGRPLNDSHGIVIAHLYPGAVVHGCASGQREAVRLDPSDLLDDIEGIAGVAIPTRVPMTFDGRPAISVDIDPSLPGCHWDIHTTGQGLVGSNFVSFGVPSRIIVVRVGDATVLLQAWAATADGLDRWLPTATRFLERVHFTGPAEP